MGLDLDCVARRVKQWQLISRVIATELPWTSFATITGSAILSSRFTAGMGR